MARWSTGTGNKAPGPLLFFSGRGPCCLYGHGPGTRKGVAEKVRRWMEIEESLGIRRLSTIRVGECRKELWDLLLGHDRRDAPRLSAIESAAAIFAAATFRNMHGVTKGPAVHA